MRWIVISSILLLIVVLGIVGYKKGWFSKSADKADFSPNNQGGEKQINTGGGGGSTSGGGGGAQDTVKNQLANPAIKAAWDNVIVQAANQSIPANKGGLTGNRSKMLDYIRSQSYYLNFAGLVNANSSYTEWDKKLVLDSMGDVLWDGILLDHKASASDKLKNAATKVGQLAVTYGPQIAAAFSDSRLKSGVVNIEDALDTLSKLRPVSYVYNEKVASNGKLQHGVIAQEIEEVMPEVVIDDFEESGYKGVDYKQLIPVLVKAVQELDERTK